MIVNDRTVPTLNAHYGDKWGLEDQNALNGTGMFVFDYKQSGEIDPTMRSLSHDKSHANSGSHLAVAFKENMRAEVTFNETNTINLTTGGGKPGQGYPAILETLQPQGYNGNYASTQETDADKILRVLQEEIGAQAFAQWRLGVFDSLQTPEVLRSDLHGSGVRCETDKAGRGLDDGLLPRAAKGSERPMSEMRETGRARRSPQGRGLSEQFIRELDSALSELSHENSQSAPILLALRKASEGFGVLQSPLSPVQRRSAGVRRLTPVECEKLQGFEPDYTLIPYRGKPASDGPRYRALGNSMAVPVMAWIGQRIEMVERER